jgi:hypothetical protein
MPQVSDEEKRDFTLTNSCLKESQMCGKNIFVITDPKRIFQASRP